MDVPAVAAALSSRFIGFKGSETELLRELFAHTDPGSLRDCPSNSRAFLTALRVIAPELLVLGVSVTIFDTGMVHVKSASVAQKEASADASLRASFFSDLPEALALRREFGGDEAGYSRFAAYRKNLSTGRIHELRGGGRVAEEHPKPAEQVDSRLPIEDQARQTWNLSPAIRSEFRNNFDSYLAFTKATANGQVRRLAPRG
jgi:hypothetical protein